MSTSLDTMESKLSKLEDPLDKSTTLRGHISKITPHGTSHWTSCFRADTISTPHRHSTFTRAPRGLIGLQYLPSNGSRNDNATAQHESSRNPDEKNEKRLEDCQDSERRGQSYFIKIAQGKNGMSMTEGEYISATDMQNVSPRFCTRYVGRVSFREEDEEEAFDDECKYGDRVTREEKVHYCNASEFVAMRSPTTSDIQIVIHQLALFHAKSAEKCSVLKYCGRPKGMFFGYHTTTHNGKLAQDNKWTTIWEECFTRNMRRMLEYDKKEGGERSVEAEYFFETFFRQRHAKTIASYGDVWAEGQAITYPWRFVGWEYRGWRGGRGGGGV
ncbi:hypothetical protein BKA58DRAFT_460061 [Alternaria rosae]|uniref:uncharacterized protein n=1 Tax=Alternaria rosae TaxID=1187941 RepID=UPI001E8E1393|nr:uncharacterized protein BKA58DRAFT_460061 [Alternaria rosae]KAH6866371.1 hypothetical protein BKA58DRAFT_460061 [Alternaria rosae]